MITLETERYYQPVPFDEYSIIESWRPDSADRYLSIFNSIPKCNSLIDICCSNGYFLFRFIKEGGKRAIGIEINDAYIDFINNLAREKNITILCTRELNKYKLDVGIYLDTYDFDNQEKFKYIEYLRNNCKYSFVSTCDSFRNQELRNKLLGEFKVVEEIYKGYQDRIIYKCTEAK